MRVHPIVLVVLLTGGAVTAVAQTPLLPHVAAIRSVPVKPPVQSAAVVINPAETTQPRLTYTVTREFKDSSFTVAWTSARFRVRQAFHSDGTLIHAEREDLVHHRSIVMDVDAGRTKVRTVVTENGKVKTDKTVNLNDGIVLQPEMEYLVPQAWSAGIRDGLVFKSLSPDGGMQGDFRIVFHQTGDPLTDAAQYQVPEEYRSVFPPGHYLVADMSLTGIAAVFVPEHFYLVYQINGAELTFRAYFGEDPKRPTFQYVVEP